jgi:anaerobic magnesium-protoporphyrin IX monomethyl ester cyclase
MTRILLVNPPFYRFLGSHYNGLPLGLAYIASTLNNSGHDAWVYNADFQPTAAYKTAHGLYEDAEQGMNAFRENGPIVQECVKAIAAFEPEMIGYSCYTATVPVVDTISRAMREILPNVLQVVGGPHATLDEDTYLRLPQIDTVIQGEGEEECLSLADVADYDRTNMIVAAYRIKHLDALPMPERDKFWSNRGMPLSVEETDMMDLCSIITARGCPWRCHYCASSNIWPKVVTRSVDSVVAEVAYLHKRWPTHTIHFVDDTFTFNEKRALSIMQGIIDIDPAITWRCEARADTLTPALVDMMKKSGCKQVKIGVESGSERILKAINKGETLDEIRKGADLLYHAGIPFTGYLMAGFPGETVDDIRQTISFARSLHATGFSLSLVAPYYGTQLYKDAIAAGEPIDKAPWECFFHQNKSMLLNHNIPAKIIDELWAFCENPV